MEGDDVDDRIGRPHQRHVAPEDLERCSSLGGALDCAALLEHEATDILVDRGQMPVQELLSPVRLRRGMDAFTQLQRGLWAVGQSRPAPCPEPPVLRDGEALAGEACRDGAR